MIVEFTGSTGSGKTALLSRVRRRLSGTDVTTSFDLIAHSFNLQHVTQPMARNLIQELVGLPFFMCSLPQHRSYVFLALRMLARERNFSILTVNNLRSVVRKLGVCEIARRYAQDRIVLVDEGTVHLAHNIFVFTNLPYSDGELAEFVNFVPLPDVLVYVRSSVDVMLDRALTRTDAPREMRSKARTEIEIYLKRAVAMFEQLIEADRIRRRVLIVENRETTDRECDAAADQIARVLLQHSSVSEQSHQIDYPHPYLG